MPEKKISSIPQQILNIRNNVEATIFQLGFHYPNDKSRYRGLIKHKMWAHIRCLWINFVRILNFNAKQYENTTLNLALGKIGTFQNQVLKFFINFKRWLLYTLPCGHKNNLKWNL